MTSTSPMELENLKARLWDMGSGRYPMPAGCCALLMDAREAIERLQREIMDIRQNSVSHEALRELMDGMERDAAAGK